MFSDREGCRFLCLMGESVPAVRRNWMSAASERVSVLKAWELSPIFEDTKPHRADPCIAKHNSNMQQLTLQFDGYADSRPVIDAGTAKQCQRGVFYEAFQNVLESLQKSAAKPSRKISVGTWLREESPAFSALAGESVSRLNAICGTIAVVFSIVMVSFASIIGGA